MLKKRRLNFCTNWIRVIQFFVKTLAKEEKKNGTLIPGYSLNLGVMCALVALPITTSLSERPCMGIVPAADDEEIY